MKTDDEMTLTELVARYPCTWDHPNIYPCEMCVKREAIMANRRKAPAKAAKPLSGATWNAPPVQGPSVPEPCGHGQADYRACPQCTEQCHPVPPCAERMAKLEATVAALMFNAWHLTQAMTHRAQVLGHAECQELLGLLNKESK